MLDIRQVQVGDEVGVGEWVRREFAEIVLVTAGDGVVDGLCGKAEVVGIRADVVDSTSVAIVQFVDAVASAMIHVVQTVKLALVESKAGVVGIVDNECVVYRTSDHGEFGYAYWIGSQ